MARPELLGGDPVIKTDPDDPRKHWKRGLAKDPDINGARHEVEQIKDHRVKDARYESTYEAVYAAIVGERRVDIARFNVTRSQLGSGPNCFDNVVVGDKDHAMFRLDSAPLFLSYRLTTGAVKLYDTATDAEYKIGKQDGKRTIFNLRYKDDMWLDDKSPGDRRPAG